MSGEAGSDEILMVFGHNSNLKLGDATLHIQTEDRGESHAIIDTTVYYRGRVLHRRTNHYRDLLPMNEDRQEALRLRVNEQHRTVIEEIRSGALALTIPADPTPVRPAETPAPPKLLIELTNAKSWLSGKHAKLEVQVREADGSPAPGARISVEFEGGASGKTPQGQTDSQGAAVLEFELPRISNPEAAMLIWAENPKAKGHLRFALRTKPRMVTR